MQRNNLSVQARTTVGQCLPDDWELKVDDFRTFVHNEISQHNLTPNDVINMDEVPMMFDIPATRSSWCNDSGDFDDRTREDVAYSRSSLCRCWREVKAIGDF